ncbi:hypothetical protein F5148DRAFT_827038 [Russula earlei]|uniref:Uncharacterized protein n=1 Tax=Russula earlei TaxID=71964 RepID=A0ACC0UCW9_9AGAM|nr:hypothetical protein F5148DRAFT_827038 [Russula earlei]
MPGPAVYVVVAIGTLATAYVLKEFIYDRHFRPKITAWREGIASHQRRRARPHSHSVSASSPPPPEDHDGGRLSPQRGMRSKKTKRSAESSVSSHIELQHLITSEIESLKSGVAAGDNTGIRQRRLGESQKQPDLPTIEDSGHILNSNSTPSLVSLEGLNISNEILTENTHSERVALSSPPPFSHAPSSNQAALRGDSSRSGGTPVDLLGSLHSQTSVLVGPLSVRASRETSPISWTGELLTPTRMASGNAENTRLSSPDTSLLSLSQSDVLSTSDQYLTPYDRTASPLNVHVHGAVSPTPSSNLSIEFLSSPSFSPPGSPFVDAGMYRGAGESPGGAVALRGETPSGIASPSVSHGDGVERARPGASPLPAADRGNVLSPPLHLPSDMSSDDGDYDGASILDSEMSSWTSDVADHDGEGAAQH